VEFIEAPLFTQLLPDYLAEEDYIALQLFLVRDPKAGDVIPGTGGFRKLRWADPRRRKGKRGGLRVIYYYFFGDNQIWFITLYGKDRMEDLSPDEKRALKAAIDQEVGRLHCVERLGGSRLWPRAESGPRRRRNGVCSVNSCPAFRRYVSIARGGSPFGLTTWNPSSSRLSTRHSFAKPARVSTCRVRFLRSRLVSIPGLSSAGSKVVAGPMNKPPL
jgi:hypothetical protein